MNEETTTKGQAGNVGIDYGPDFNGDVGAILKSRLLIAITNHRTAEEAYTYLNDKFMAIADRWSKAQDDKTAARDELINAASAWETWEQQQRRGKTVPHAPQTAQEAPGRAEAQEGDQEPAKAPNVYGGASYRPGDVAFIPPVAIDNDDD